MSAGAVRSMTGQGSGSSNCALGAISVELRSVNQRGLKISPRMSDALSPLEPRFEQSIRARIQRGTVQANASFSPSAVAAQGEINVAAIVAYATQLRRVQETVGGDFTIELTGLLELPGAVVSGTVTGASLTLDAEQLWPALVEATNMAIAANQIVKPPRLSGTGTPESNVAEIGAITTPSRSTSTSHTMRTVSR